MLLTRIQRIAACLLVACVTYGDTAVAQPNCRVVAESLVSDLLKEGAISTFLDGAQTAGILNEQTRKDIEKELAKIFPKTKACVACNKDLVDCTAPPEGNRGKKCCALSNCHITIDKTESVTVSALGITGSISITAQPITDAEPENTDLCPSLCQPDEFQAYARIKALLTLTYVAVPPQTVTVSTFDNGPKKVKVECPLKAPK